MNMDNALAGSAVVFWQLPAEFLHPCQVSVVSLASLKPVKAEDVIIERTYCMGQYGSNSTEFPCIVMHVDKVRNRQELRKRFTEEIEEWYAEIGQQWSAEREAPIQPPVQVDAPKSNSVTRNALGMVNGPVVVQGSATVSNNTPRACLKASIKYRPRAQTVLPAVKNARQQRPLSVDGRGFSPEINTQPKIGKFNSLWGSSGSRSGGPMRKIRKAKMGLNYSELNSGARVEKHRGRISVFELSHVPPTATCNSAVGADLASLQQAINACANWRIGFKQILRRLFTAAELRPDGTTQSVDRNRLKLALALVRDYCKMYGTALPKNSDLYRCFYYTKTHYHREDKVEEGADADEEESRM
ncbi:uncharacterized protein LOC129595451 [Paramacrobiotus metropolitanus]|uniref:uncharacterized protein LOC129595451 n=1 Tax=Paramacrobiotus metropolitanus TaxID=2943436 RepID=UPI00244576C5|nr:uncharacterized protein LOC129595451 [Paramacrobiotus metropolitanus]